MLQSTGKLIVDTHYLIWDLLAHPRFTDRAKQVLSQYEGRLFISGISFWEIGMLIGKEKIQTSIPVRAFCNAIVRKRKYQVLPITPGISEVVAKMATEINGDPADRVIAASAIFHKATLLTADQNLVGIKELNTLS